MADAADHHRASCAGDGSEEFAEYVGFSGRHFDIAVAYTPRFATVSAILSIPCFASSQITSTQFAPSVRGSSRRITIMIHIDRRTFKSLDGGTR